MIPLPNLSVSSAAKSAADVSGTRFDNSNWNVATGGGSNGLPTWALLAAALAAFVLLKKRG